MNNQLKLKEMAYSSQKQVKEVTFSFLAEGLLSLFPERVADILGKRFGIGKEEKETLEKIGRDYGITRERVRQIISDTMKKIALKCDLDIFKQAEKKIIFTIEENNGIIKENEAVKRLSGGDIKEENSIRFFVECSQKIKVVEDNDIDRSWILSHSIVEDVRSIGQAARKVLEKEEKMFEDSRFAEKILKHMGGENEYTAEKITCYLDSLVCIKKNRFEKWGLHTWREVNPKGTREKIYLILKEKKKPLHFREIAKYIDIHKLAKKKAHPQTIHNELIKNSDFVLIGRGIYALAEWGYKKGTVRDVLKEIFIKEDRLLHREEVLTLVSKERYVKKATVMINLNNPRHFLKKGEHYLLKK